TLVAAGTNLLARGFLVVPTDRKSKAGAPVNALFAVARAIRRAMAFKTPTRAVCVIESKPNDAAWPDILKAQLEPLSRLVGALGVHVVVAPDEAHLVASYASSAKDAGDDVIIVGVDKRYAQLVDDRLWWYDANKDVRYTSEIVLKRFTVQAPNVGDWLALVGDDSGNAVLPWVKGIGAKGATSLIEEHGSIGAAMEKLEAMEGRLGKALRAAKDDVPRELARGRLDRARALPVALDAAELAYAPPNVKALNAVYEELGFSEPLGADGGAQEGPLWETKDELLAAIAKLGAPVSVHALMEDAAPVRQSIAGIALASGKGEAFYVPAASAAWPDLARWLADPGAPKIGHNLVALSAELRR